MIIKRLLRGLGMGQLGVEKSWPFGGPSSSSTPEAPKPEKKPAPEYDALKKRILESTRPEEGPAADHIAVGGGALGGVNIVAK